MNTLPLQYNTFYHLYNRGINSCALFHRTADYEHFLRLYGKYLYSIANTYAWVLMGNHFHLLVKTKTEQEIGFYKSFQSGITEKFQTTTNLSECKDLSECEAPDSVKKPNLSRHFSHLFNAYTRYFNLKYKRTGGLFETPFRRIEIKSADHLKYLIYYIHHNPVHHGFCDEMIEYPWSSYLSILSPKQTQLKREEVINWYGQPNLFTQYHEQQAINRFMELQIDLPIFGI